MEVDTVKKWAREFATIVHEGAWSAGTDLFTGAQIATGAGVHGGDEHEVGRVFDLLMSERKRDMTVFHWLAERF